MKIKLTKAVLLSNNVKADKVGSIHDVEDDQAKALINIGYASEYKGKGEVTAPVGATTQVADDMTDAERKAMADAPENKAKTTGTVSRKGK